MGIPNGGITKINCAFAVKRYQQPLGTIAGLLMDGGHSRIRTYDFHRVKVALYR